MMSIRRLIIIYLLLVLLSIGQSTYAGVGQKQKAESHRVRIECDTTLSRRFLLVIPYIEKNTYMLTGQLISVTSDSISIATHASKHTIEHRALNDVNRLWICTGKRRATLNGLKIGAGIGACLFLMAMGPSALSSDDDMVTQGHPLRVIPFWIGSAAIGGIIGYLTHEDRWQPVERKDWPRLFEIQLTISF